jgi:RNA polymerase sigma factor (sigma-70 family)
MEATTAARLTTAGRLPASLLRLASDDRLVDHVRGGSETAFEAVFDRHHRGILAFCRHMLGSAEEAEDALQHTFLAAYRDLLGSSRPVQLRPWLYTIARNRCISVLRAGRERPSAGLEELSTENLAVEVQRRQELRDLLRDVGQLPDDQRAALVLAEVAGVSHDEISAVLGVRREKVKALVFQARASLIASRAARDTPCADIRVQLAELRGAALRRNTLRRHLKGCRGCREFLAAVREQHRMLGVALPVAPTWALKPGVIAGTLGSGAAGATTGGSLLAGGGTVAKVLAAAVIAGGGAAGIKAVGDHAGAGSVVQARQSAGGATPAAVAETAQQPSAAGPATSVRRRGDGRRSGAPGNDAAPGPQAAGPAKHAAPPAELAAEAEPGEPEAPTTALDPAQGVPHQESVEAPKPVKPENPVKPETPAKAEKPAKAQKPAKAPKPEKPVKPEKSAKAAKPPKPNTAPEPAKPEKPEKAIKPAKPDQADSPPPAVEPAKPANPDTAIKPAKSDQADVPAKASEP